MDPLQSTVEGNAEDYGYLVPPEGHEKLGKALFAILAEIIKEKSRLGLPGKWNRHYELSKNKHWRQETDKVQLISANLLHAHRQRTVNLLTDNNPTFDVARIGTTEEEKYDVLVKTAEYWWNETEQQSILEKSIINGEVYGCTVEKVSYYPGEISEDREGKLIQVGAEAGGEVETDVVHPFYFGFYPFDVDDIQKASVVVHYRPMQVWEARLRWPEHKDTIKSDDEWMKEIADSRKELVYGKQGSLGGGYLAAIGGMIKSLVGIDSGRPGEHKSTLVAEFWVKDYTMVGGRPKYRGCIRCITVCNGGDIVLEDKDNPSINPQLEEELAKKTYLWDKFPFSITPSDTEPDSLWGMSDFEQLDSLQVEINKSISQMTLYKDKASRLKLINPANSGVDNAEFTNLPGVINPTNEMVGNAIRYMEPPKLPADIDRVLTVYKDLFAQVAGSFDMERAQDPAHPVIAYKAIAALIERINTMNRGKIRNYSRMIRQRGRMYISHAQNWYTEERLIPVDIEGEPTTIAVLGRDLILPGKITVVSGSTMPISRVQQREEDIELFNRQAIDAEELLKALGKPGYKEILRRMAQGPLADLKMKMQKAGAWPQIMDWISKIEAIKPKDIEKELEKGEITQFPVLIHTLLAGGEPTEGGQPAAGTPSPMEEQVSQAEAALKMAHAKLFEEQTRTEQVKQAVMLGGVKFDEEKLKTDRAKVVHDMEMGQHESARESARVVMEHERGVSGIKSDNKQRAPVK